MNELQQAQQHLAAALESQQRIMEKFHHRRSEQLRHFQPLNAAGDWGRATYYDRRTLKRGLSFLVSWHKTKVEGIEPRYNVVGSQSPSPVGAEHAVQLAERELARIELVLYLHDRADEATRKSLAKSYAQLTSLLASELRGRDMSADDAALLALETILPQAAETAAYMLGDSRE